MIQRDRLTRKPPPREHEDTHEMEQVGDGARNGVISSAPTSMQDFLVEITSLQSSISELKSNIRTISTYHSRSFQFNIRDEQTEGNGPSSAPDKTIAETRALMSTIKRRIQYLGDAIKTLAQNGIITKADADSRWDHLNNIRYKFMEAIQEYQGVEQEFNARSRDTVARQYKIVRPEATPEEVKEVISGNVNGQQIFAEATLASSSRYAETRAAYREVQECQEDIIKVERTIAELVQLYRDMAYLIEEQDVPITEAENHAIEVEENVVKGKEQTEKAVNSAHRARRMRIILFWLFVLVLLVVGLAVGLSVGLK
ncbi:hypothetical protein D9758_010396 [Tetrapyrgos nigripes]|uniref:t-SNARE coiled-coil homology domain-containing protein n=1 Tax=Tetrapyrgos nigripes TaxID=182062 RepID=A0A8H5D0Y7_9AGAR|nr:hypothetical protein D9758_010396 [Tetrapyrgos nigripes]